MEITRYLNLTDQQFLGCVSAFVDSLFGQLNSAILYLRKLEGQPKGAAFAFEMSLDHHRYGALLILDRWAQLIHAFGPHLAPSAHPGIVEEASGRVQTAENILGRANQVIDSVRQYSGDVVAACALAFQSLNTTFAEEAQLAARSAQLGPMLSEEYLQARGIFLRDLAAR